MPSFPNVVVGNPGTTDWRRFPTEAFRNDDPTAMRPIFEPHKQNYPLSEESGLHRIGWTSIEKEDMRYLYYGIDAGMVPGRDIFAKIVSHAMPVRETRAAS